MKTCPHCGKELATKAKRAKTSDGYTSVLQPGGKWLWTTPEGKSFTASFPYDQKRYETIVRKHKSAALSRLCEKSKNIFSQSYYVPHIDSGYPLEASSLEKKGILC